MAGTQKSACYTLLIHTQSDVVLGTAYIFWTHHQHFEIVYILYQQMELLRFCHCLAVLTSVYYNSYWDKCSYYLIGCSSGSKNFDIQISPVDKSQIPRKP